MKYYNSIHICPLEVFKNVQLENDYKHLLISGTYDKEKAYEAWVEIMDAYQEAVKSNTNNTLFELQKQYEILKGEYDIIKVCIFVISQKLQINLLNELLPLEHKFDKLDYTEDVKNLNKFGYKFDINKIDSELLRVEKQSKGKITQIKRALGKIEKQVKDNGDWTINDTIFIAQKHMGFPFTKDAKVIDLVVCLNDRMRNIAMQKAQLKKQKHAE